MISVLPEEGGPTSIVPDGWAGDVLGGDGCEGGEDCGLIRQVQQLPVVAEEVV